MVPGSNPPWILVDPYHAQSFLHGLFVPPRAMGAAPGAWQGPAAWECRWLLVDKGWERGNYLGSTLFFGEKTRTFSLCVLADNIAAK